MNKLKFLRYMLIPILSVSSIFSVSLAITSCAMKPAPKVKYELSGGSLSLSSEKGKVGYDEKQWILYKDDEPVTESVTWSILGDDIDGLLISDGFVKWTSDISIGEHKFKVNAKYENNTYESEEITLEINEVKYKLSGGGLSLSGAKGEPGFDSKKWVLYKNGIPLTDGVNWSIHDPNRNILVNNGIVSWTNEILNGVYTFKVVAKYENNISESDKITLTISNYELTDGSISLSGNEKESGSDKKPWVLKKDSVSLFDNVKWSIEKESGDISVISISKEGLVKWTSDISSGTYRFKVKSTYTDPISLQKYVFTSGSITLIIGGPAIYDLVGGSLKIDTMSYVSGLDTQKWRLKRNAEEITHDIIWSINPNVDGVSIADGKVSWNNKISNGTYSFKVIAEHEGKKHESKSVTLNVISSKYSGIEINANEDSLFKLVNIGDNEPNLFFSYDKYNWFLYVYQTQLSINKGKSLYLKGDNLSWSKSLDKYSYFDITGNISVSGSVMNLLDNGAKTSQSALPPYCFFSLFNNCRALKNIDANFLPSPIAPHRCYSCMFSGCSLLSNSPSLPATLICSNCYSFMFEDCKSLLVPPQLPASVLAESCYEFMFSGCSSLLVFPYLPAEQLSEYCYYGMFCGCERIVRGVLPGEYLAKGCYDYIFYNCKGLVYVNIGYKDTPGDMQPFIHDWAIGVNPYGQLYATPAWRFVYNPKDYGFPEDWEFARL